MSSALVLGAGVVGISTALCLRERGWDVALVDRKGFGRETSFGNAGIIQADAVEPYAMPRSAGSLVAIATGKTNDTYYRLRDLPALGTGISAYWWHSSPRRYRTLSEGYAKLGKTATAEHQRWISAADAESLIRREGYRVMFRKERDLERAARGAARLERDYSVPHRLLDRSEFARAEPNLRDPGAGALQWLSAWTVSDPGALMSAYGATLLRMGGSFHQADVRALKNTPAGWSIDTSAGPLSAEHVVVALGPWSPEFLNRLGRRVRMLYKRGYHIQLVGRSGLDLTLVDADYGYVLAPMKDGIRLTTGVHLAPLAAPRELAQLTRAEAAARALLDLGLRTGEEPWMGTRPFMPEMLPVIGRSAHITNLWLNFGHGHQGLTLGPSSGRMLAELMNGDATFVEHQPFAPNRYDL